MPTTYNQLLTAHIERLTTFKDQLPEQVLRNHKSALNSYLLFCGKTMEHHVGREFTTDFLKKTKAFSDLAAGKRKTAADKLSILRAWKKTVDALTRATRLQPVAGVSIFHKELRLAVAASDQTVREIANAIKAAPLTLPRWLEGANPVKKGLPTLRRLEAHLGLTRGYLESKLEYPRKEVKVTVQQGGDKFMERLVARIADRFYLRHFSVTLKEEWFRFLKYKTAEHPVGLRRSVRGRWRVLDIETVNPPLASDPYCHPAPGLACPTAGKNLQDIRGFLGFLMKDAGGNLAQAGLGMASEDAQTLVMLVMPEFINGYFEFLKARSGNVVHSGHNAFAGSICSLVRKDEGYLWQQPELYAKVEKFAKGRSWQQLCDETREVCLSWQAASKGKKSRDPKLPLQHLLSLEDPLKPFQTAIKKLDLAAANCSPGSSFQATYKRDALLLAMELVNPLRLRTMTIAKYVPFGMASNYQTNLYQTEKGIWRLRFFKGDFKNDGAKDEDYDAPFPAALSARIEEYLEVYRPVLVRNKSDSPWLFPNIKGAMHKDLGLLIANIAQNYIPEVARLRPHALRHIVATDFLRRNPGQYTHIAELLHDNLETVLKHYSHGKKEAAFLAHEEHMQGFFEGI